MRKLSIAVDAMGGDYGPKVTVAAALIALAKHPDLKIILVGNKDQIKSYLPKQEQANLAVHHASEVVAMDEPPAAALRSKKDSSIRVACELVKSTRASACVSAGNTGALMAVARYVIKTIPGIARPAISFPMPSLKGKVYMLDLGANLECSSDNLLQFAIMAYEQLKAISDIKNPSVGLLNVGSELIKGTEAVKTCAKILEAMPDINYYGFVEGDDIYKGTVDIVVCDGFVGNVTLKASEGLAHMITYSIKQAFKQNWYSKALGLLAKPVMKSMLSKFDSRKYNGGSLLGLQGVVIKSHGKAKAKSFAAAIEIAYLEAQNNVPQIIKQSVANKLKNLELA